MDRFSFSEQSPRWMRYVIVFLGIGVLACCGGFWVVINDLQDLQFQVAALRQQVNVEHDSRVKQIELVLADIEQALVPGISDAKNELRDIGKEMRELKAMLHDQQKEAPP